MLGQRYDNDISSVARALEVIGERWTMLIVRDAFLGVRRFDDFQRGLGVARNVLAARLARLVAEGVMDRVLYQRRPDRHEYRLTEKGEELWPVVVHLMEWGDRHYPARGGVPQVLEHRGCGGAVSGRIACERCGRPVEAHDVVALAGPGSVASAWAGWGPG
jgi:DNA-binding HxlR family transcriptional regulator